MSEEAPPGEHETTDLANMQPIERFVEHYMPKCEWEATQEYVVYNHATSRFRIALESPNTHDFIGLWRQEVLADAGIDTSCGDAKEFAKRMMDTMFYHLSPHEAMHFADAVEAYLDEWHEEHKALVREHGGMLPAKKRCPY